jgi:hypothetical protein
MYKSLKRGDKLVCSDTKGCGYDQIATPADIEKFRPKNLASSEAQSKSVFSL